ncbi:MAG: hypothetical protein IPP77_00020 [Bacteroidetes bacterium]|nr:hypothetical protein [Bacteroidota bacterium]
MREAVFHSTFNTQHSKLSTTPKSTHYPPSISGPCFFEWQTVAFNFYPQKQTKHETQKKLRKTQLHTLHMLAMDYTYSDIIGETGITRKAVDGRIARLKKYFGVETCWGLVAEAERRGFIDLRTLKKMTREAK